MKYEEVPLFNENELGTSKIPLFKENQSALKEGGKICWAIKPFIKYGGGWQDSRRCACERVCDSYSKLKGKEVEKGYISNNLGICQKSGGNFLTMANVEEKMKGNNFGDNMERGRASDNTWTQNVKGGQMIKLSGSSKEGQGKRKRKDINEGGVEMVKKGG